MSLVGKGETGCDRCPSELERDGSVGCSSMGCGLRGPSPSNANGSAQETIVMLESTASLDVAPARRNLHVDPHSTKRDAGLSKHQNQTLSYSSHDLEPIVAVR